MSIFGVITFASIALTIIICIYNYVFFSSYPWFLVIGIISLFLNIYSSFSVYEERAVPVKYTFELTKKKILIYTDRKVDFESEKLEDCLNWSSSHDGYIITSYNHFGRSMDKKFTN